MALFSLKRGWGLAAMDVNSRRLIAVPIGCMLGLGKGHLVPPGCFVSLLTALGGSSEALIFSEQAKPSLIGQVDLTTTKLTQNATPLTSTQSCGSFPGTSVPNAVFGYGLLNILKAVQAP